MTRAELITAFQSSSEVPASTLKLRFPDAAEDEVVGTACDAALPEFSRDRPRKVSADKTWEGALLALEGWIPSSHVLQVEYPKGAIPPTRLARWRFGCTDQGELYLPDLVTGTEVRVTYTATHVLPAEDAISIDAADLPAFFKLVASILLARIAVVHGESQAPDIAADVVSYQTKSGEYTRLAREAYAVYCRMVGRDEKRTGRPALGFATMTQTRDRVLPLESPNPARGS